GRGGGQGGAWRHTGRGGAGAQVADLAFEGEAPLVRVVEVADLDAQGPRVDRLGDDVGDAEGVGGGAELAVPAEGGEQDDRDVLGLFQAPHVADHVQAAGAGGADVEQHQADGAAQQLLEGLLAGGGAAQQVAQRGEGALQRVEGVVVAVDDEDPGIPGHGGRPSS